MNMGIKINAKELSTRLKTVMALVSMPVTYLSVEITPQMTPFLPSAVNERSFHFSYAHPVTSVIREMHC